MMNSPLLSGNDLRSMSTETIEILTNKELIAIDQDAACIQAERILNDGTTEVWVKPLGSKGSKCKAIAIINRSDQPIDYTLNFDKIGITKSMKVRDLWLHKELGKMKENMFLKLPVHAIVVLKLS